MTLLDRQTNRRRASAIRALVVFAVVLSCFICTMTVFASAAAKDDSEFRASYMNQIHKVYNLFVSMMLPVAVVGFASSCVSCLLGSTREVEKATRRILMMFIAIACLYMLPAVVSTAMSIFSNYAYSPPRK